MKIEQWIFLWTIVKTRRRAQGLKTSFFAVLPDFCKILKQAIKDKCEMKMRDMRQKYTRFLRYLDDLANEFEKKNKK